jgi:hypothetical protein
VNPDNTNAFIKFVLPIVATGIFSILAGRQLQAPRNAQGAVGYSVTADRINKLEAVIEQDHAQLAIQSKQIADLSSQVAALRPPTARTFRLNGIAIQGLHPLPALTPLQRVPSRLEHLPAP